MKWAKTHEGLLRFMGCRTEVPSEEEESGDEGEEEEEGSIDSKVTDRPWRRDGWVDVLQVLTRGHEKDDYEKAGYFLLVNMIVSTARIVPYYEESYYSSKAGIRAQGEDVVWEGALEELFRMAEQKLDPKMPVRTLCPQDFDYEVWTQLFGGIAAWRQEGCPTSRPQWHGRMRGGTWESGNAYEQRKTPYADERIEITRMRMKAAARIQAAFRGWRWRMCVLFNPHTEVGRRHLELTWERDLSERVGVVSWQRSFASRLKSVQQKC